MEKEKEPPSEKGVGEEQPIDNENQTAAKESQTSNSANGGTVAKEDTNSSDNKNEDPMDVDETDNAAVASPPSSPFVMIEDEALLATEEDLAPYDLGEGNTGPNSNKKPYIYASTIPTKKIIIDPSSLSSSFSYNDAYFGTPSLATTTNAPRQAKGHPYSTRVNNRNNSRSQSLPSDAEAPLSPTKRSYPRGPSAAVKPIRRLTKIRPYANQNLPVMVHEIKSAIPKDATSVFHVLDRRVNLDALDAADASKKDVNVPMYALLRAWVQDDPYRQIPPTFPIVSPGEENDDVMIVSQKRVHTSNALDNYTIAASKRQNMTAVDVIGNLATTAAPGDSSSSEAPSAEVPSMESLKMELVQQARETRKRKNQKYKQRLKHTLQGLRQRGILLG